MKGDPHGFTLCGCCTGVFRRVMGIDETLSENRRRQVITIYWIGGVVSILLLAYLLAALLYPEKFS